MRKFSYFIFTKQQIQNAQLFFSNTQPPTRCNFTKTAVNHKRCAQRAHLLAFSSCVLCAEWTGFEPATPCVTGMYSNQLNYHSVSTLAETALTK